MGGNRWRNHRNPVPRYKFIPRAFGGKNTRGLARTKRARSLAFDLSTLDTLSQSFADQPAAIARHALNVLFSKFPIARYSVASAYSRLYLKHARPLD